MAEKESQNLANHGRFVPFYHFVISLIVLINLGWSIWKLIADFSGDRVIGFLVAVALVGIFWYSRIFPLAVQDRVIRLEMRLRLQEVLPKELRGRIAELEPGQLIGLRFASDEELPDLVSEVLAGSLQRGEIKKRIKDWQADTLRC